MFSLIKNNRQLVIRFVWGIKSKYNTMYKGKYQPLLNTFPHHSQPTYLQTLLPQREESNLLAAPKLTLLGRSPANKARKSNEAWDRDKRALHFPRQPGSFLRKWSTLSSPLLHLAAKAMRCGTGIKGGCHSLCFFPPLLPSQVHPSNEDFWAEAPLTPLLNTPFNRHSYTSLASHFLTSV